MLGVEHIALLYIVRDGHGDHECQTCRMEVCVHTISQCLTPLASVKTANLQDD